MTKLIKNAGRKILVSEIAIALAAAIGLPAIAHADKLGDLYTAAKKEGALTVIALPHDWCGYGDLITAFKAKYPGITVNELNPDAGSADELQAIRANEATRALPVVVLTTSTEPFDVEATYALGVNSYIQKPVDFEQFVWAVKQVGLYWLVLNHARA